VKQEKIARKKQYQNFDFVYKRTLFRSMMIFFKTEFKPYLEEFLRQKDSLKNSLQTSLVRFVNDTMPGLTNMMSK